MLAQTGRCAGRADDKRPAADDTRLAEPLGRDRRMARRAADCREESVDLYHERDIVRHGVAPEQNARITWVIPRQPIELVLAVGHTAAQRAPAHADAASDQRGLEFRG